MSVRAPNEKTKSALPKRTRPPYTLPSNIVYFHDWRYVDTGSFAYVDMKNPIPNAPEKKATAYATYWFHQFSLTGDVNIIQDWIGKDNAVPVPNTYPMNDYMIFNLSLSGPIYGPIHFNASLKNVLDTQYEAMYGYPMPGRMAFFDMKYDF